MPERHWPALARVLSPLAVGYLSPNRKTTAAVVRRTLGARLPELSGMTILREMAAEGIIGFLQVLKCRRPGHWHPRVALVNSEHVDAALRAGRGALLWVAHGFHGHLGAKVGFARAGLAVSHLSRATHGISESRFGTRVLNPIQAIVEDRYLGERILIRSQGKAPLDLLARRLRANGVVSITAQRGSGRTVEVPFLDGGLRLAGGAPALAHKTGAALLPVFAFRNQAGVVEVVVESPIGVDGGLPHEQAVDRAVRDYVRTLEPDVLRYPGQWLGWVQLFAGPRIATHVRRRGASRLMGLIVLSARGRLAPSHPRPDVKPMHYRFAVALLGAVATASGGVFADEPGTTAFAELGPIVIHGNEADNLLVGAGVFDLRHDETSAATIEYRFGRKVFVVGLAPGLMANADGGLFGYVGTYSDLSYKKLYVTPQLAMGGYHGGDSTGLGGVFQFRLSLDVAFRFDNGHRLGVRGAHISNAGVNEQNPGEEELFLTYSVPLGPYL